MISYPQFHSFRYYLLLKSPGVEYDWVYGLGELLLEAQYAHPVNYAPHSSMSTSSQWEITTSPAPVSWHATEHYHSSFSPIVLHSTNVIKRLPNQSILPTKIQDRMALRWRIAGYICTPFHPRPMSIHLISALNLFNPTHD